MSITQYTAQIQKTTDHIRSNSYILTIHNLFNKLIEPLVHILLPDQLFDFIHNKSFVTLDELLLSYQTAGIKTVRYGIVLIILSIIFIPCIIITVIICISIISGITSQIIALRWYTKCLAIIHQIYYYITDLFNTPSTPYRRLSIQSHAADQSNTMTLPSPFRLLRMIPSPATLSRQGYKVCRSVLSTPYHSFSKAIHINSYNNI